MNDAGTAAGAGHARYTVLEGTADLKWAIRDSDAALEEAGKRIARACAQLA